MRALFLSGLVLSTFVLGCSGTDSTNNGSGGGGPTDNPDQMNFDTGSFVAPAGDSFTCFYLDAKTPKELSVTGATAEQGPGGHHILIYYTDVPRSPTHHPCVDSGDGQLASNRRRRGQDGTGAEGIINLPEGLAIKVPAGKQLVIQSHYINTTGKSETVDDTLTMQLIDPAKVKMYANSFANSDEGFEIPPNGSLKRTSVCTIPQDLNIAVALGHEHEWGTHFSVELQDGDKAPEMIYTKAWDPVYASHPPVNYYSLQKPLVFKAGQKLIQTCEWQNTTPKPLAFPDEMCVGFFYYFPDNGDLYCNPKASP